METREVLVANTKTQRRYKISTDATTLSELKAALDNNGIDYQGMSFTEGISNTQLLDGNSILPNNARKVKDRDGKEYGLVVILTNTKKDIASGVANSERAELFAAIKENHLQNAVMQEFGRNMTQVSTAELRNFVHIYIKGQEKTGTEEARTDDTVEGILAHYDFDNEEPGNGDNDPYKDTPANLAIEAIGALVKHFSDNGILNCEDDWDGLYGVIRDSLG